MIFSEISNLRLFFCLTLTWTSTNCSPEPLTNPLLSPPFSSPQEPSPVFPHQTNNNQYSKTAA